LWNLPALVFAVAAIVGLLGAFIGLDTSSLWYDELFTAWVIGVDHDPIQAFFRALSDVHPPFYYISVYAFSYIDGSDVGLRIFSAICAVSSLGVIYFGLKEYLSLEARLLFIALATSSRHWFVQSQSARSYSLIMLIVSILVIFAIKLNNKTTNNTPVSKLFILSFVAVALIGISTHFYMIFVVMALFSICAAYFPKFRTLFVFLVAGTFFISYAYVKLIVSNYAKFSQVNNWIGGNFNWYITSILDAANIVISIWGYLLIFLLSLSIYRLSFNRTNLNNLFMKYRINYILFVAKSFPKNIRYRMLLIDSIAIFVPLMVLLAGVLSSIVLSPNFTGRNLLVTAPVVWIAIARLYDFARTRQGWPSVNLVTSLGSVLMLLSSGIVVGRFIAANEPWREAAAIADRKLSECDDPRVLIILNESRDWAEPVFTQSLAASMGRHYSKISVRPIGVLVADLAAGHLPKEAADAVRLSRVNSRCPLVAEWIHAVDEAELAKVHHALERQLAGSHNPGAIYMDRLTYRRMNAFGTPARPRPAFIFSSVRLAGGHRPALGARSTGEQKR
jgi:hypothetical protein